MEPITHDWAGQPLIYKGVYLQLLCAMKLKWPVVRDIILFVGGFAGVLHETLLVNVDRPTLLILFAAMMGMPAFFHPVSPQQPPPSTPPQVEIPPVLTPSETPKHDSGRDDEPRA